MGCGTSAPPHQAKAAKGSPPGDLEETTACADVWEVKSDARPRREEDAKAKGDTNSVVGKAVAQVSAAPSHWDANDSEEFEVPLSTAASRLSEWVYGLGPLDGEYVGTWRIDFEVLNSIEADGSTEDIQKASVAVTITSAHKFTMRDAVTRSWSRRVLFMVFRGTVCLQDWLQNAACVDNRVSLQSYGLGVHSGIWTYAANDFLRHGQDFLEQVSREAKGGTKLLVFTGHSLGGGLASVAHMLVRLAIERPDKLPCHGGLAENLAPGTRQLLEAARALTFAAPMIFTASEPGLDVETYLQRCSTNYVYNNDPVPRFPGELNFIQDILSGVGALKIPLADGVSVDIGSNIADLAKDVPALARYRHLGTIALVQGDGEVVKAVGDDSAELLRCKRDPTEGGGIRNWWSGNAYDAGLDHRMERYAGGLPWRRLVRTCLDDAREVTTFGDFANKELGDGGAIAIVEALRGKVGLTYLALGDNYVGDVGAASVADCLRASEKLTRLDLSRNHVGDAGAVALAEGCQKHPCIKDLNLRRNLVGKSGAEALADALKQSDTLCIVDLSENRLNDAGAIALGEALRGSLRARSLRSDVANSMALNGNVHLEKLCLSLNKIGDPGATALAQGLANSGRLRILALGCNQVGDLGALALARAAKKTGSLRALDLSHNRIGLAGESAVADVLKDSGLISVDLHGNSASVV